MISIHLSWWFWPWEWNLVQNMERKVLKDLNTWLIAGRWKTVKTFLHLLTQDGAHSSDDAWLWESCGLQPLDLMLSPGNSWAVYNFCEGECGKQDSLLFSVQQLVWMPRMLLWMFFFFFFFSPSTRSEHIPAVQGWLKAGCDCHVHRHNHPLKLSLALWVQYLSDMITRNNCYLKEVLLEEGTVIYPLKVTCSGARSVCY